MYPGKNGENATSKKFKRDSSVNIVTDSKTDDSTSDSAPPLKTSNSTESTQAIDKIYKGWSQFATDAKYSDVTFEVGDRQFALHRLLLAKVSAKFTSMFDQKPAFGSVFKLVDISSNIFELILKFVYKGSLDLFVVSEQVEDLLIAADKYAITELKYECEEFLSHQLTLTNVAALLSLAEQCNANKLKLKAFELIKNSPYK